MTRRYPPSDGLVTGGLVTLLAAIAAALLTWLATH